VSDTNQQMSALQRIYISGGTFALPVIFGDARYVGTTGVAIVTALCILLSSFLIKRKIFLYLIWPLSASCIFIIGNMLSLPNQSHAFFIISLKVAGVMLAFYGLYVAGKSRNE
jgi:hypothetical protein